MTATAPRPRTSAVASARNGFPQLLHAEWTKLRTVRSWPLTLLAGVLVTVLISLFSASSSRVEVAGGGPPAPTGPEGRPIRDSFTYAHRTLPADGGITARVTGPAGERPRTAPAWAKAGVLMKESTRPGSPYAALMLTAGHGVRLQSEFTRDEAGPSVAPGSSYWLRLVRNGASVTAYASADGRTWDKVGGAELPSSARTVTVGLFVASPTVQSVKREFGNVTLNETSSRSTARFDHVTVDGATAAAWQHTDVGDGAGEEGELVRSGEVTRLTGSGDIGPAPPDSDLTTTALNGTQLGLVLIAALGVLFITAEYRRGMIRTTFTAAPRRGRALVAKSLIIAAAAGAAGLLAALGSFLLSMPVLRDRGHKPPAFPDVSLGDGPVLRAVLGTAAVLALIAVLALALGALLRSTAAATALVVVIFVLPLVLIGTLPLELAQGLQRFTPMAGFAIQQTAPRYDQVADLCLPEDGCYPQAPWTGFATLVAYVVVVLGVAVWRVRRRDA